MIVLTVEKKTWFIVIVEIVVIFSKSKEWFMLVDAMCCTKDL